MYVGTGLAIAAAGIIGTGAVMTATVDDPSKAQQRTEAVLPLAGAAVAIVAKMFFSRSTAAATLAGELSRSLASGEGTERVHNRCTSALAVWDESRDDAAKIAGTLLDRSENTRKNDKPREPDEKSTEGANVAAPPSSVSP
jgi:hypothetical protein